MTQGRTGRWAKRLRCERESGRNDPGAKRLGAKGKVGETTQGRTGKWAKRPGFTGSILTPGTFFRGDLHGHEKKNSTTVVSLPLIQEGQLSVIGERMCTKYW